MLKARHFYHLILNLMATHLKGWDSDQQKVGQVSGTEKIPK